MSGTLREAFRMAESLPSERQRVVVPTFRPMGELSTVAFQQTSTAPPGPPPSGEESGREAREAATEYRLADREGERFDRPMVERPFDRSGGRKVIDRGWYDWT